MSTTLGNAYVQILPSAQGISQNITKELGGSGGVDAAGKSAGNSFGKSLIKTIAGLGIGAVAVKGLKEAFSEGAALQQSFGGLETLYGDAADAAKKYAQEAAAMGISANSYAEQAVSFGASLKAAFGGDTTKAVEAANTAIMDMTDNAAKMGTPIESIQAAYQGFAKGQYTLLDNLKLGYGGTKTEMERLLKDASKLTGQKYDINNLGDVYDAIHVIQGELGLTGVAADEAKTTFSGSFGAMAASAKNFFGALTTGGDVAGTLGTLIESAITFVSGNLIPMLGSLLSSLPGAISTVLSKYGPQAGKAFMDFFQQAINRLPEVFSNISGLITSAFETIDGSGIMETGFQLMSMLVSGIFNALPSLLESFGQILSSAASFIVSNLPQFLEKGFELISQIREGIWNALPEIAVAAAGIISNILTTIGESLPDILQSGFTLLGEFIAGIISKIPEIPGIIAGICTDIGEIFGDTDWEAIGTNLLNGVIEGIKSMITSVGGAVGEVVAAIDKAFNFSGTISNVKQAFEDIKSGISEKINSAKETVHAAIEKIKGFFNFSWSLPPLKLPHISVTGGEAPFGIGGKGSLPHFSISWYKKAEDNPYMFSGATLFGAGERNDEILYGKHALMRDIATAVSKGSEYNYGDVTINVYATENQNVNELADEVSRRINAAINRKRAVWA